MEIFKTVKEIQNYLSNYNAKSIGFVPTMGALHKGHISLINTSKKQNDITVCTIFVNPKQFNKKEDLVNYPRNINSDIEKLSKAKCDVVFIPSAEEIYPSNQEEKNIDFGRLAEVMEGKYRKGHFSGVAAVIKRFFEIINPSHAYFGEKDFQQLIIISVLTKRLKLGVNIIGCPIYREPNGLAMSSRNERLTEKERKTAGVIKKSLDFIKSSYKQYTVEEIKKLFIEKINQEKITTVEYIEIADGNTLKPIKNWDDSNYYIAFTAVNIRSIRLIDNLVIINNQY